MPRMSNGTFAESQDEYIVRLERENTEARLEITNLKEFLQVTIKNTNIFQVLNQYLFGQ